MSNVDSNEIDSVAISEVYLATSRSEEYIWRHQHQPLRGGRETRRWCWVGATTLLVGGDYDDDDDDVGNDDIDDDD